MKHVLIVFFCLFLSAPAWAVTHPDEKLKDPAQEARALALTQTLRCVVCQNESIEASHADIAKDLRILVRKQVAEGKTDAEIIAFLRARYGDYILLEPPFAPRTWMLWLAPLAVLAGGTALAYPYMRRKRRRRA